MNDYGIKYDHTKFHPKEENLEKLARSNEDAKELERHEVHCPICGMLRAYTIGEKKGIVQMKCTRCKYDGPINLAYFRRLKPYRKHVRFEPWRFYPDADK